MTISSNPGSKSNGTAAAPGYTTYPSYPGSSQGGYPSYPGSAQGGYPSYPGSQFPGSQFPGTQFPGYPSFPGPGQVPPPGGTSQLPLEESYIENILRLNLGKVGTFYMTYENNKEWNAKIFRGVVEAAGRDHIIISDPKTGMRFLLLMVNLDYATFDEPLNYFNTPIQPR
ncbi:spore coat protein GerQ [Paenibacillus sp. UNC499MF]|uniref:spore coat protein GerQ n=1 Tax=Paenibacillus sp. UNC499MF TaxID=1502751 RepID=UPI0008A04B64|nr:spore coat protein GerQ [Paenibacillus sp. UNC499MF]SEG38628.1 spore germination protein Q [Paenibacillus sp. UNC499MF]